MNYDDDNYTNIKTQLKNIEAMLRSISDDAKENYVDTRGQLWSISDEANENYVSTRAQLNAIEDLLWGLETAQTVKVNVSVPTYEWLMANLDNIREFDKNLTNMRRTGDKAGLFNAIKSLRSLAPCSLTEAKRAVEAAIVPTTKRKES